MTQTLQQAIDAVMGEVDTENLSVLIIEAVQCLGPCPLEQQAEEVERVIKHFIAPAQQMAQIIRKQAAMIEGLRGALDINLRTMHRAKVYEVGMAGGQTTEASYERQCMWRLPLSVRDSLEQALTAYNPATMMMED